MALEELKIPNDIKELEEKKLDKTDIVNTTTQIETNGKALNAVQANPNISGTLANQINVLSGGNATLSITDFTQIDSLTTTGIYNFYISTSFTKDGIVFEAGGLYTIDVKKIAYNGTSTGVTQVISCNYPMANWDKMYFRAYYVVGGWGTLQQIATTTKTEVICTPKTGFVINSQKNIMIGNRVQFNMQIAKTDGTAFGANTSFPVVDVPSNCKPSVVSVGSVYGFSGSNFVTGIAAIGTDGIIYIVLNNTGAIALNLTCEVIL